MPRVGYGREAASVDVRSCMRPTQGCEFQGIDRPRPLPPRAVLVAFQETKRKGSLRIAFRWPHRHTKVGPVEDYPGKVKEAGELPKCGPWSALGTSQMQATSEGLKANQLLCRDSEIQTQKSRHTQVGIYVTFTKHCLLKKWASAAWLFTAHPQK